MVSVHVHVYDLAIPVTLVEYMSPLQVFELPRPSTYYHTINRDNRIALMDI